METTIPQEFTHEKFGKIRVIIINGKIWFVSADVCRVLAIADTHVALRKLDDDEKGRYLIPTLGGPQEMSIVNEPGLYRLIFASRKEKAKEFQRWVYHEVIPKAVREKLAEQSGIYVVNNFPPELSERWADVKAGEALLKAAKMVDSRRYKDAILHKAVTMLAGEDLMPTLSKQFDDADDF